MKATRYPAPRRCGAEERFSEGKAGLGPTRWHKPHGGLWQWVKLFSLLGTVA